MSEHNEAQALARWLDEKSGTPPPKDMNPGVIEAVLILKPSMAPPAQLSIEDVLEVVTNGPFLDSAIADTLKDWLQSEPGTPPPPALPIGVVETAYALHPNMAPETTLRIEDVLDGVRQGPFARTSHLEAEDVNSVERDLIPPTPSFFTGHRPLFGAFAMAAISLFVMIPKSEQILNPASPYEGSSAVADQPEIQSLDFTVADNLLSPNEPPQKPASIPTHRNTKAQSKKRSHIDTDAESNIPSTPSVHRGESSRSIQDIPPTPMVAAVPPPTASATEKTPQTESTIQPLSVGQTRPRSRTIRRDDRALERPLTERTTPSPVNRLLVEVSRLHRAGMTEKSLRKIEKAIPEFMNDPKSQRLLLQRKVSLLRDLGRETEAQQIELAIKKMTEGG
jgi:hypothetical protein